MTDDEKRLVKHCWSRMTPIAEETGDLFYRRLFDSHPEVKAYFKGDMRSQARKLFTMINAAVTSLDDLDRLSPMIRDGGRRHAGYGVKEEDYAKMRDALFQTLRERLGDEFTDEVENAWLSVYNRLSGLMMEGAAAMRSQDAITYS